MSVCPPIGDELFVLGSILFSVAAFISALLAVSEEASIPSKLIYVSPSYMWVK